MGSGSMVGGAWWMGEVSAAGESVVRTEHTETDKSSSSVKYGMCTARTRFLRLVSC